VWIFANRAATPPAPSATRAIQNMALQFANVDEVFTALQAKGIKLIGEPRNAGTVRYVFAEDANGVRVELVANVQP